MLAKQNIILFETFSLGTYHQIYFFSAVSIHGTQYGVPSGPSRFYSVISTRENSKVRKVETTKTKPRKHEDENAKTRI